MKNLLGDWNYYLVRYAVPSIVGGFIVAVIMERHALPLQCALRINLSPIDAGTAVIFWVLGLAYCYIASAPILFIHAIRGWFKHQKIDEFYCELAEYRAKSNKKDEGGKKIKEYVESYRVLREHGNAFAIIFFEFLLASLLLYFQEGGILLFVWIAIGAISWGIATMLEFKITNLDSQSKNSGN